MLLCRDGLVWLLHEVVIFAVAGSPGLMCCVMMMSKRTKDERCATESGLDGLHLYPWEYKPNKASRIACFVPSN